MLRDTFRYHNVSWRGDPRWAEASPFTRRAPVLVVIIFLMSIAQIALGSMWIVQDGQHMTVPKIIQTLLIPGLSFFNALPSLHLHLLLRSNPPLLAICFSSFFVLIYLISTVLLLASCVPAAHAGPPNSLRRTECPRDGYGGSAAHGGVTPAVWDAMVATGFVSAALYACHAAAATWVRRVEMRKREERKGMPIDEVAEEERRKKARELWVKMTKMQQGF